MQCASNRRTSLIYSECPLKCVYENQAVLHKVHSKSVPLIKVEKIGLQIVTSTQSTGVNQG